MLIVGLDPKEFALDEEVKTLRDMEGKSAVNPGGDKQLVDFQGDTGFLVGGQERKTAPFSVKTSYSSEIDFADTICINQNFYDVYDAGCRMQQKKTYSGQGGALAVDGVETILMPGSDVQLEFRIHLRNRGRGKVEEVRLREARLGNEMLECTFQRSITDKRVSFKEDQEATVICRRLILPEQSSYTTTLALSFEYDYERSDTYRLYLVR